MAVGTICFCLNCQSFRRISCMILFHNSLFPSLIAAFDDTKSTYHFSASVFRHMPVCRPDLLYFAKTRSSLSCQRATYWRQFSQPCLASILSVCEGSQSSGHLEVEKATDLRGVYLFILTEEKKKGIIYTPTRLPCSRAKKSANFHWCKRMSLEK